MSDDKSHSSLSAPTSAHLSRPLSQRHGDTSKGLGRNPTIKISRATRVSEQWNASLDREITNANELRHLDEFLGNQVSENEELLNVGGHFSTGVYLFIHPQIPVLVCVSSQVNDFRSRGKSLSATEAIFVTATMQFRETIKAMYSLPVSLSTGA